MGGISIRKINHGLLLKTQIFGISYAIVPKRIWRYQRGKLSELISEKHLWKRGKAESNAFRHVTSVIKYWWLCWDLWSITFRNFDQNIKCSGKHWIEHSKYQATKNRWSYHLVWMRKHTYSVPLKEFLKLFKCLASSGIHTVSGWLDLLFKALHQERKRRKERIPTRLAWAPLVVVVLPLFIDIWYEVFS